MAKHRRKSKMKKTLAVCKVKKGGKLTKCRRIGRGRKKK